MARDGLRGDRRAVSITVSHVLTIAITAVLVTGLIAVAAGALTDERERAARSQIETIGQRLAFEVEQVGTLATRGDDAVATLNADHTDRIVDSRYEVMLTDDTGVCAGEACLVLTVSGADSGAVLSVDVSVPVTESTAPGGAVRIVYDDTLKLEEQP